MFIYNSNVSGFMTAGLCDCVCPNSMCLSLHQVLIHASVNFSLIGSVCVCAWVQLVVQRDLLAGHCVVSSALVVSVSMSPWSLIIDLCLVSIPSLLRDCLPTGEKEQCTR